jgi:hypothetical protein
MRAFNIFEGSRRIALLLRVIWVIGVGVFTFAQSPYVSLSFSTPSPTSPFVQTADNKCNIGTDGWKTVTREIETGKNVSVSLCFEAMAFEDGRRLVPYKVDQKGLTWGNGPYSSEVEAYRDNRAGEFTLSESDQAAALQKWALARRGYIRSGLMVAIGGWVVLWLSQCVIGWIVRGFMGIPRGQDRYSGTRRDEPHVIEEA